jgi:hypothetical protein
LPQNFYFGGGSASSTMHPIVLLLTMIAFVLVVLLPRKYALAPAVCAIFLLPFGAQMTVSGQHFFVMRIIAVAALCRLLRDKFALNQRLLPGGMKTFDKIVFAWAICRGVAFIILQPELGAVISQVAFWLDTFALYTFFRHVLCDQDDISRLTKVLAFTTTVLAFIMVYEQRTGFNIYNLVLPYKIVQYTREGQIRAQASFGHAISAGTFAAVSIPLFYWAWKSRKAKGVAVMGLVTALVMVVTSQSSTPASACLAGVLVLFLWPVRRYMREMRWVIVLIILLAAIVMNAPVWYLLQRVDIVGGHGWDRAFLVDQFARHLSDWWLIGTNQNASWSRGLWDRCNQYVAEGASGGLVTLSLFIGLLSKGFSIVGRGWRAVHGTGSWLYWCLGAALLAHLVAFQGISYWDQMKAGWLMFLALFPAVERMAVLSTSANLDPALKMARHSPEPRTHSLPLFPVT